MDRVVACLDGDRAVSDIDVSDSVVLVVLCVQAVLVRLDTDRTVCHQDGFVGLEGVSRAGDIDRAAGDLEVILAADAVLAGDDIECPRTVYDQVIPGEDHGVRICIAVSSEGAGDRQCIFGICCRDKDLVGILNVDTGSALVGDRDAVQDQLYLVLIAGRDDDLRIGGASRDHIDSFFADRVGLSVTHGDIFCPCQICCLLKIAA